MKRIEITQDLQSFFDNRVKEILQKQKLNCSPCARLYLSKLLERFSHWQNYALLHKDGSKPMVGESLLRGGRLDPFEQLNHMQNLGDYTLFTCGFFGGQFNNRLLDMDYFCAVGESAYERAGQIKNQLVSEEALNVFFELASSFAQFKEVFAEIADESKLFQEEEILEIYQKWVNNGSRRLKRMLMEKGISLSQNTDEYEAG